MKYLKTFENHAVEYLKSEIRDHLQYIIDDFDMEELPKEYYSRFNNSYDDSPGIFYYINDPKRIKPERLNHHYTDRNCIEIFIWVGEHFLDKFNKMEDPLNDFYDQMRSMGYRVVPNERFFTYRSSTAAGCANVPEYIRSRKNDDGSYREEFSPPPFIIKIYYNNETFKTI